MEFQKFSGMAAIRKEAYLGGTGRLRQRSSGFRAYCSMLHLSPVMAVARSTGTYWIMSNTAVMIPRSTETVRGGRRATYRVIVELRTQPSVINAGSVRPLHFRHAA